MANTKREPDIITVFNNRIFIRCYTLPSFNYFPNFPSLLPSFSICYSTPGRQIRRGKNARRGGKEERKALSTDSRFAQVWFQNARAKWRRNMMRQEGNTTTSNVGCPGTPVPSNTAGSPNVGPAASILGDSNSMPSTSMEELHALHHLHSGVSSQVSFSDLY